MSIKYWEIKAKADKVGELLLYGDISSGATYDDNVTPKAIDEGLKALGEMDTLNIYVNSGGGQVFAGMAIYNIIKRCNAKVKNAYVDGLAASISSVIPMAADKVYMPANSMMMIHNPSGGAWGNSDDMRKMAETLDKVRDTILQVYVDKTGKDEKELKKMMDAETWMSAKDAIEMGFADELQEEVKIAASVEGAFLIFNNEKFEIDRFKNVPRIENETPLTNENGEGPPQPISDSKELIAQQEDFKRVKNKIYGGMSKC